jgi:hypothetical protein
LWDVSKFLKNIIVEFTPSIIFLKISHFNRREDVLSE